MRRKLIKSENTYIYKQTKQISLSDNIQPVYHGTEFSSESPNLSLWDLFSKAYKG